LVQTLSFSRAASEDQIYISFSLVLRHSAKQQYTVNSIRFTMLSSVCQLGSVNCQQTQRTKKNNIFMLFTITINHNLSISLGPN